MGLSPTNDNAENLVVEGILVYASKYFNQNAEHYSWSSSEDFFCNFLRLEEGMYQFIVLDQFDVHGA